jgi:hypothetical protein
MKDLLKNGYHAKKRPSGHDISKNFAIDNGAAIPPNLIALANTESNSFYLRYCRERDIEPHPARYPSELPEYFIRMLTDPGDFVIDPFAGSCVTGEVCERLKRHWACMELSEEYLRGAIGRFVRKTAQAPEEFAQKDDDEANLYYKLARPGLLWNSIDEPSLAENGGKTRNNKETPAAEVPAAITNFPNDTPSTNFSYSLPTTSTLWHGVEEARQASDEPDQHSNVGSTSVSEG